MKIVSPKISPIFFPKLGEDQNKKKRSSLKFSPIFLPKIWSRPKTKVFAYHLCAQNFCPTYKDAAMPQFCILVDANYTIQATQRGGIAQWPPPPKYAPDRTSQVRYA